MSVRDGLLAVLTLGPAYGLQLHAEFIARAPHRAPLNVGQVYSTLDRAGIAQLVQPAGTTPDGLPLTRLTNAGRERALHWMSGAPEGAPSWEEMLDQVLITSTVAPHLIDTLVRGYRELWSRSVPLGSRASELATRALADAAEGWLAAVGPGLGSSIPLPLSTERPRRGRRPGPLVSA